MDKLLMFLAYMGLVFGTLALLLWVLCLVAMCYDRFTRAGRLGMTLLAIEGKRRIYPLLRLFVIAVVGLGWFLTWRQ